MSPSNGASVPLPHPSPQALTGWDAQALQAVIDTLPSGITFFGPNLELIACNARCKALLELPESLFVDGIPTLVTLAHHLAARGEFGPGDPNMHAHVIIARYRVMHPHVFEHARPNGTVLEVRGAPLARGGFVTTYTDITDRKRAEAEVRRARDLMTEAINGSAAFVWELDADGRYTYCLGAEKLLGFSDAEMIGRRFGSFHADCPPGVVPAAGGGAAGTHEAIARCEPFKNVTICLRRKDGATIYLSSSGHPVTGADGRTMGYRGVDVDLTELTEARMALERQALHDPLTGLANRRKLLERYTLECERQRRWGKPVSLLVIDIDHFKRVNDRHGHLVGDVVLTRVAALLDATVRRTDMVARFGGEEFVVLLPETDADGAAKVAESLRTRVRTEEVRADSRQGTASVRVTISIGAATVSGTEPLSFDDILERADRAVYSAKHTGRDRFVAATARPAPSA